MSMPQETNFEMVAVRPEGKNKQIALFQFGRSDFFSLELIKGESPNNVLLKLRTLWHDIHYSLGEVNAQNKTEDTEEHF